MQTGRDKTTIATTSAINAEERPRPPGLEIATTLMRGEHENTENLLLSKRGKPEKQVKQTTSQRRNWSNVATTERSESGLSLSMCGIDHSLGGTTPGLRVSSVLL